MTIHLPQELESFVHDAVRAGRYTSEDEVIRDALQRLRKQSPLPAPGVGPMSAQRGDAEPYGQAVGPATPRVPMTEDTFKRQLVEAGLMTSLPTPADPTARRDFQPVHIEGEPLSETIVRERR